MKKMTIEKLIQNVDSWSSRAKIHAQSNAKCQMAKAAEEYGELLGACIFTGKSNDIKDAIGDMTVCLINVSYFLDISVREELKESFEIKFARSPEQCLNNINNYIIDGNISLTLLVGICTNLKMICNFYRFEVEECFKKAWDEIKFRKLIMRDGLAVKWENMTDAEKIEYEQAV